MHASHLAKIDLNLLLAFHTTYTERSVSRAAERLGMTQSGLSHALARLRQLFGDDLLVRSGGRMVATPRAEELYEAVKEVIDLLESRVLPIAHFDPRQANRLFTTAMSDMGEVVALRSLNHALRQRAPGCTIRNLRLPTREITDALETGHVELALGNVFEPTHNIYQQTLYTHGFRVLAWEEHPRLRRRLSLEQYLAESHLVVDTGSDEYLRSAGLVPLGFNRHVGLTVGGLMSAPWILIGTELLATVPSHLATLVCGCLPIMSYPIPFALPDFAIKTYWHPRSQSDAGHRWFRELVYEVLHTYPSWLPTQNKDS